MTYTKQQWQDGSTSSPYGPISAARLQHIETGLDTITNGGSQSNVAAVAGSPYQETATKFGNYTDDPNPFGNAGKGSPAYAFAPFVIDENFGRSSPNSSITKTTQAAFIWARYYGPTTDDSAEAGSSGVVFVDTGTPFTTAQPAVGFEGIAILQGGNISTSKLIGVAGSAYTQGTAQATSVMSIYASTLGGAGSVSSIITNYYGVYQDTPQQVGTITNLWGGYFKNQVQIETYLTVGVVGAATHSAQTFFNGPNVTGGATDLPSMIVQQGAGQTASTLQLRTSAGSVRGQWFGSSGNLLIGNGPGGAGGVGIISMVTTTNPSGSGTGGKIYVDTGTGVLMFLDAAGVAHALY